jgi:hypothetical protein
MCLSTAEVYSITVDIHRSLEEIVRAAPVLSQMPRRVRA